MRPDLVDPVPPPESGETTVAYFARLHCTYRTVPVPGTSVDVETYYRDVVAPWDDKRVRYVKNKRSERKSSRKTPQRHSSKTRSAGNVSVVSPGQSSRQPERQSENDEGSTESVDVHNNVRELPVTPPLTRSQQIARERDRILSQPRYVPYRRDCTPAEIAAWRQPGDVPEWERPGFIGTCPTWFHPSGWVNGVVDENWREKMQSYLALETSTKTAPETRAETRHPWGCGGSPLGGTNHTTHPTDVSGQVVSEPMLSAPSMSPSPEDEKSKTNESDGDFVATSIDSAQQDNVVPMPSRQRQGDRTETRQRQDRDNADLIEVFTELTDRIRAEIERRMDERERHMDERDRIVREVLALVVSALPSDARSVLGETVVAFIDGRQTAPLAAGDAAPTEAEVVEPPEPVDAWDDDGKLIRHAWDVAVGDTCGLTRGPQWFAQRQLYAIARGLTSCEDEALTLFMWWVEMYSAAHAEDRIAVYQPQKLLLQPRACPAELPEERRAPEHWTSRPRVFAAWKAMYEGERDRQKKREQAVSLDEQPPPESGWDAGLDEDEPNDGTGE